MYEIIFYYPNFCCIYVTYAEDNIGSVIIFYFRTKYKNIPISDDFTKISILFNNSWDELSSNLLVSVILTFSYKI